jgi:hypothetical protein
MLLGMLPSTRCPVVPVERDLIIYPLDFGRTNAPWNLARLSTVLPLTGPVFNYTYDSSGGNGVDIYILGEYTFGSGSYEFSRLINRINWTFDTTTDSGGSNCYADRNRF